MNIDEEITESYLKSQGYSDIIYEPDGNIPPDFLIEGEIAVEVRRLNKYISDTRGRKNIEDLKARLHQTMVGVFNAFKDVDAPISCFVFYSYRRPLTVDKHLKEKIKCICEEQLLLFNQYNEYDVDENLSIRFLPAEKKLESVFRFGGFTDYDASGFVVSDICKNIQNIIHEKEKKVLPYKSKYKEWWLALVDRIGWGVSEQERDEIRKTIHPRNIFEKILIVNPVNPDKGIFLYET